MKIGIDFDNTIASYDTSFREVALAEGFIDGNWEGKGKTELRDHLRRQPDGEKTWMKLQGLIYGKHMHRAELVPGVANFFLSCKGRNHRIFIVSHKTEYGHYDPVKISLRGEALKWMEVRRFFEPEYFGLDRKDVFFADTREEKVNIIARLNCDWFIDDLPEVFEENHFPASTQEILFGTYKPDRFQNRTAINSWRKISEKILGQIIDQDVIFWVKSIVDESIDHIEKIPGQGNSTVYQIHVSGKEAYALKYYPDKLADNRPRLKTEFQAFRLLHQYNIINVPKVFEKDEDLNLGLYEWMEGESVIDPTLDDLKQAVDFVNQLHILSWKIDESDIKLASEACLSAADLIEQIEQRLWRIKSVSVNSQNLHRFFVQTFEPLWKKVKEESYSLWPLESRDSSLPREKQTLSPSDFGFHNALQGSGGKLTFIDFDYFGWDDPVKLTADFIWHPAMNLNSELKEKWKIAMLEIYSGDPYFEDRLNAAMPLYGLRWAMIVLNEFLPGFTERRRNAGRTGSYDERKSKKNQLAKARRYCERVERISSQLNYA